MIALPSTIWMALAVVVAVAAAAVGTLWAKIQKARYNEKHWKEAQGEMALARAEAYAAVRSGDANRVRRAANRLRAAERALRRYRTG